MTPPRLANAGNEPADLFAVLRERDVLVHHPYDSFTTSVEAFIAQAAADPDVLAIKQTLYRTSGDSPIVASLIQAAEAGKQVAAVVELKARFDEQANIAWARALEEAGVHVVYGLVGLKTHSKAALVVRREEDGIRRYCHIGTGNYNPRTARQYEDLGLLSADPDLGADVGDLFNFLTGYSRYARYRKLVVAPMALRQRITELIEDEARAGPDGSHRHQGERAHRPRRSSTRSTAPRWPACPSTSSCAACAACAPVCPGLSDTIRVRSIVGRFLEHSRIYRFGGTGARPLTAAHGLGRPHGAQPRPPHRGPGPGRSTPSSRPGCSRCSTSTWPTTPTPGSSAPTGPGSACPPSRASAPSAGSRSWPGTGPGAGARPRPSGRRASPSPSTSGRLRPSWPVGTRGTRLGGAPHRRRRRATATSSRAWRRRWRQPSPENRSDR